MHEDALKRQLEEAKEIINALKKELRKAHEELQRTTSELLQLTLEMDDRVAERTEALRNSEEEVRRHRDHLQELVKQRTSEIEGGNQKLELKLKELSASEERFRSLMMTIPDIVYRIDREGKFTFLNDAVQKLNYNPKELIGKHFSEIMLPEDAGKFSRSIVLPKYAGKITGDKDAPKLFDERRSGERKTTGLEVRLVVKGGQKTEPGLVQPIGEDVVAVEVNSAGIWEIKTAAQNRKFIGTVGVIRDITDRKQMEMELKESETRLRTIFDTVEAGIVAIDSETHVIVEANPAAVKMMGYHRDQVVGSVCHEFICPNERGKCPVTDLGKKVERAERSLLTSNRGAILVLKTVTSIQFRGRTHLLESFVDITDLKQAENTLKERTAELQVIVNAMSGREVRMAELKKTIRKLQDQMKAAGMTPVADDPLKEGRVVIGD